MGGLTLLVSLCVSCVRPLLIRSVLLFFVLFNSLDTKEQRKHETCVHHSCNYEALCCAIDLVVTSLPTEIEAKKQNDIQE